jgi:hypothetical protein
MDAHDNDSLGSDQGCTRLGLNEVDSFARRTLHVCTFYAVINLKDRFCGLVIKVSGCRHRDPGFDSRRYQIF